MEGNTGKQKKIEEFRYYEMPMGRYDLALLGDKWITHYQTNEQHFHNFFEIAYCHYGEGFVYMGEESPSYQKGSITLIPANFPHGIQSAPGRVCFWEFLYVDIMGFAKNCGDEDACAKGKLLQNLINIPLLIEAGEYPRLSGLVLAILEENREKRFRNREAVNGYLYVLLQEMIRMDENMFRSQGSNMLHVEKIRPALVYVELHYSKEIKIKELARACSVSEPYFRRLFTECMNMAPLEYINMVRVQKACDFLKKEDLSMNALAWKVGFSSVSTLERNFKKIVGASPKQWKLKGAEGEFFSYRTRALRGW